MLRFKKSSVNGLIKSIKNDLNSQRQIVERKIVSDVAKEIHYASPVATGFSANEWMMTIGARYNGVIGSKDTPATFSFRALQNYDVSTKNIVRYFISNNSGYMKDLVDNYHPSIKSLSEGYMPSWYYDSIDKSKIKYKGVFY